jgi:hypothetical protein
VLKPMGKHYIDPKRSEIRSVFKFFIVRRKLPFLAKTAPCPYSLRSLDIPALEILAESLLIGTNSLRSKSIPGEKIPTKYFNCKHKGDIR